MIEFPYKSPFHVVEMIRWLHENVAPNALVDLGVYSLEWRSSDGVTWSLRVVRVPAMIQASINDPEEEIMFAMRFQ